LTHTIPFCGGGPAAADCEAAVFVGAAVFAGAALLWLVLVVDDVLLDAGAAVEVEVVVAEDVPDLAFVDLLFVVDVVPVVVELVPVVLALVPVCVLCAPAGAVAKERVKPASARNPIHVFRIICFLLEDLCS